MFGVTPEIKSLTLNPECVKMYYNLFHLKISEGIVMANQVNGKSKKCQYEYNGRLCGRPLYDSEFCIFHSSNIEEKKAAFDMAFQKEFER
jgi:hypothetical protein